MDYKFLRVSKSATNEVLEILIHNIIGTPGVSMLYKHMNVRDKIGKIWNPYFINLMKGTKLIGTCCFCRRMTANAGREIHSFYVRYFSFKQGYRKNRNTERSISGTSLLKEEVKSVLAGKVLGVNPSERFYHYAYVDPRNTRSARLCKEFGFEPVRNYTTIIFNRIAPKDDSRIKIVEASPSDEVMVRKLLSDFYKNYTMFSFDNLFHDHKYYVIKNRDNKIVAGVQVNPDQWKILSLPGISGKLILNTFTHIPVLNRLFNKNYRFLTLEGIYYTAGYEHYLEILFESLLAKYKLNSAIIVVDSETQLYKTLKSLNLGLVDKLNKEVNGNVICKFINFTNEEKQSFKTHPAYVSGIDVT